MPKLPWVRSLMSRPFCVLDMATVWPRKRADALVDGAAAVGANARSPCSSTQVRRTIRLDVVQGVWPGADGGASSTERQISSAARLLGEPRRTGCSKPRHPAEPRRTPRAEGEGPSRAQALA